MQNMQSMQNMPSPPVCCTAMDMFQRYLSSDFVADARRPVDRADSGNACVCDQQSSSTHISDVYIFQRQAFFSSESLDARISIFSASKIQRKFSVETQQKVFRSRSSLFSRKYIVPSYLNSIVFK